MQQTMVVELGEANVDLCEGEVPLVVVLCLIVEELLILGVILETEVLVTIIV
jgi:hypothetical protein